MDAAVLRDDLQQTLHIGGVQLLIGAVLQNVLDEGIIPQGVQRLGVGGPAALGLFAVGKAHRVEQHLTQLLGAVGIEARAACLHLDAGQHLRKLAAHPPAEFLDAGLVHKDAGASHIGQHLRQRKFDLVVKRVLALRSNFGFHLGEQVRQRTGVRPVGTGERGLGVIARGQFRDLVLGSRSVEQVSGQLAVPDDAAAPVPVGHGQCIERGRVEHVQRHGGVVEQTNHLGRGQRIDGAVLHGIPCFGLDHDDLRALFAHDSRTRCHEIAAGRGQGQDIDRALDLGDLFRLSGGRDAVQTEAGDERMDLQLLQKPDGSGLVALADLVSTLGDVDRRIGADRAQRVAQFGIGAAFQQVLALFGLDGFVVDVGINALQAPELLHQRQRGLFADAAHARDIVGRVAHQALDLDELAGLDAVFFLDRSHIHHDGLAPAHGGGRQQNGGALAHQLQAVAVSGGKKAVVLPGVTGRGQRAQDVVGLPALGGDLAIAEVGQKLLQHRHLLGQFLGHPVAGGLVAVVHLVAEGRGAQVERDGDLVRFALLEKGKQNIQKAVNGIGIAAVFGGQQLDAEKGTVRDAVAVNDQ